MSLLDNRERRELYRLRYKGKVKPTAYVKRWNHNKMEELISLLRLKKKRELAATEEKEELLLKEAAKRFLRSEASHYDQNSANKIAKEIVAHYS